MKSKMHNSPYFNIGFSSKSYSLDFSQLSRIHFSCEADYVKAEKNVLECADYLTSTPLDMSNVNRGYAETFLLLWMNGTTEYSFNLNKKICKIIESNISLLSLYIAFVTKYVLANKDKLVCEDEICSNVIPLLIDYCKKFNISGVITDLNKMFTTGCRVA